MLKITQHKISILNMNRQAPCRQVHKKPAQNNNSRQMAPLADTMSGLRAISSLLKHADSKV